MNKFVARGLADEARAGRSVLVVSKGHSVAMNAMHEVVDTAGGQAVRTNGRERVTFEGGGTIWFKRAGIGVRGLQVDTVFVERDVASNSELMAEIAPCALPTGEIVCE